MTSGPVAEAVAASAPEEAAALAADHLGPGADRFGFPARPVVEPRWRAGVAVLDGEGALAGNFRLLADGRLGVLDFGAVDRLPDGLPPLIGKLLRLRHEDRDLDEVGDELRSHGFLRDGVSIDLAELRAFLAPLAEPSRAETFRFSREWLRGEAMRVARLRSSGVLRRLNLPPSYVLIHRVSTAGIGVLCQLECEAPFRAEMLRWMPGYADPPTAAPQPQPQPEPQPASAPLAPETEL